MRLRKESDDLQEEEVLLIANVSDALAHPVRIRIFRYIMKCNAGSARTGKEKREILILLR